MDIMAWRNSLEKRREIGKLIQTIENHQLRGDKGHNENSGNASEEQKICKMLNRENY